MCRRRLRANGSDVAYLVDTVDGLVAVGTILLAVGTLAVALVTWRTARATKLLASQTKSLVAATVDLSKVSAEEVEISRRALQAEVKPLIVDWPADNRRVTFSLDGDGGRVSVPACNAGAPGLIQGVTMHWDEPGAAVTPTTYRGTATVLAVMSGGETEAHFDFTGQRPRLDRVHEHGKFWVEIAYTDAAGGQAEVTRLDLYRTSALGTSPEWRVWAVSFRRADETEPYAEARPANR